jgi:hypothetical protein
VVTSLTKVTVGIPLVSLAVTLAGFGTEPRLQDTVVLGGRVMVGNVLSNTVMV